MCNYDLTKTTVLFPLVRLEMQKKYPRALFLPGEAFVIPFLDRNQLLTVWHLSAMAAGRRRARAKRTFMVSETGIRKELEIPKVLSLSRRREWD